MSFWPPLGCTQWVHQAQWERPASRKCPVRWDAQTFALLLLQPSFSYKSSSGLRVEQIELHWTCSFKIQTYILYCRKHSRSSLPFSLPRSFLSFLGFFKRLSSDPESPVAWLWLPGRAAPPGVLELNATGVCVLQLGVGTDSPSATDWYCNKDFSRNLEKQSERVSGLYLRSQECN